MKIIYCPECAATLDKQSDSVYLCSNGHYFYVNPKATAVIVLQKDDKFLFTKRGLEPNKGLYDFPGGFIDFLEDPYEGAVRELEEELGITVQTQDLHLLDAITHLYVENNPVCDLIFVCTRWEGEPKAADDVASFRWESLDFVKSKQFVPYYSRLPDRLMEYLNKQA